MKKYLPVGSIVLLKNTKYRVMVIGYKPKIVGDDKIWDYSGCPFPEGVIDAHKLFVFNDNQIDKLFFIGLQDTDSMTFLKLLGEADSKKDDEIF